MFSLELGSTGLGKGISSNLSILSVSSERPDQAVRSECWTAQIAPAKVALCKNLSISMKTLFCQDSHVSFKIPRRCANIVSHHHGVVVGPVELQCYRWNPVTRQNQFSVKDCSQDFTTIPTVNFNEAGG